MVVLKTGRGQIQIDILHHYRFVPVVTFVFFFITTLINKPRRTPPRSLQFFKAEAPKSASLDVENYPITDADTFERYSNEGIDEMTPDWTLWSRLDWMAYCGRRQGTRRPLTCNEIVQCQDKHGLEPPTTTVYKC
ncbi:hypothetical protein J6590_008872 [Homalodisca vitripennis]|nr:hypothetical protein J6590_008872 [Homalodisca vitripennis]